MGHPLAGSRSKQSDGRFDWCIECPLRRKLNGRGGPEICRSHKALIGPTADLGGRGSIRPAADIRCEFGLVVHAHHVARDVGATA